ncbi:MAG: hypothetical protein JNL43_00710, partial [Flavobacteriales bacterium]|nr:hypothetical protein [Flavobacteriales bacterium]
MGRHTILFLLCILLCLSTIRAQQSVYFPVRGVTWPVCESVPDAFVQRVRHVLADSARMFPEYPEPVPFTCDLLKGLQEAMTDDSVRYHFEHLSQRYWSIGPDYNNVERYIDRHLDFHLAIACTGHFFCDVRIMGLKKLYDYRRMRPMVCATKEHYILLEKQDRQAVRYLIHALENTPWSIPGSENASIHDVYINEIVRTLDLFTGQFHPGPKDLRLRATIPDADLRAALIDWRKWLNQ